MQVGDIVIYPSKIDRYVNIGQVTGEYDYVEGDEHGYPNQRSVQWLGHFPRDQFRQVALNEIGSAMTQFRVRRNVAEFLSKVGLAVCSEIEDDPVLEDVIADIFEEVDDETAMATVIAQASETTSDLIIKTLHGDIDGYEFEHFVAHILECMGYAARVTPKSGDGGVDVIAHKDELGFEPPIIKVQCKRRTESTSDKEVSQLLGTLGDGEFGLFVNLGSYSRPARILERNKSKLRLIDGEELVGLILLHYEKMSPRYRSLIPLKQVYIPDL